MTFSRQKAVAISKGEPSYEDQDLEYLTLTQIVKYARDERNFARLSHGKRN